MEFPNYEEPEALASPPTTSRRTRSASESSTGTVIYNPQPPTSFDLPTRGRRRSNSFTSDEHPVDTPNSADEFELARLVRSINEENERAQAQSGNQLLSLPAAERRDHTPRPRRDSLRNAQVTDPDLERARRRAALTESGGCTGNTYRGTELTGGRSHTSYSTTQPRRDVGKSPAQSPVTVTSEGLFVDYGFPPLASNDQILGDQYSRQPEEDDVRGRSNNRASSSLRGSSSQHPRPLPTPPSPSFQSAPFTGFDAPQFPVTHQTSYTYTPSYPQSFAQVSHQRILGSSLDMSYQNYLDSPQGNPSPNPRQAPPSPAQNMNPNGMNGGMGMGAGYPTPAGHQQDLIHIMSMVESLSAQLAHNNAMTANIVEMTGRVREIAQKHNLTNEELIALSAHSLDGQARNLDKEMSDLQKKLDKAAYDREEWKKLSVYCCNVLSNILDLARDFKGKHEADTLLWHKNYRNQLADEREENLRLRCELNDWRAGAMRANNHLNDLRDAISDSKPFYDQEVRITQWRQQARFWKRMAMPYLPDDDPEFSDDDDIIDPEEKKRQQAEREAKEGEDKEGGASTN